MKGIVNSYLINSISSCCLGGGGGFGGRHRRRRRRVQEPLRSIQTKIRHAKAKSGEAAKSEVANNRGEDASAAEIPRAQPTVTKRTKNERTNERLSSNFFERRHRERERERERGTCRWRAHLALYKTNSSNDFSLGLAADGYSRWKRLKNRDKNCYANCRKRGGGRTPPSSNDLCHS